MEYGYSGVYLGYIVQYQLTDVYLSYIEHTKKSLNNIIYIRTNYAS
jgi:hypothetical protein